MRISIKRCLFFIWTFYLLFMPPVMRIAPIVLIGIFSWLYIFFNIERFQKKFVTKRLIFLFVLVAVIDIYLIIVSIIMNGEVDHGLGVPLYLALFGIPSAIAYILGADKYGFQIYDIIEFMIKAGILEGMIAIASLTFYDVQTFFVNKLYFIMNREVVDYWRTMRLYGWASGMTYSMPILAAAVGILAVEYSIKRKSKYLLAAPVIWIAGILNARTSMVVIIVGFACVLLSINYYRETERNRGYKLVLILGVFLGFIFLLLSIWGNDQLVLWVKNGISEIGKLLLGERTGYFSSIGIISNTLETPQNIFFGQGKVGTRSDVGYIRDLWLGGLLYVIPMYLLFVYLIYKMAQKVKIYDRSLSRGVFVFFTFTIFIVNIKGQIISANEFIMFFFLWVIYFLFYRKESVVDGGAEEKIIRNST